MAGKCLWGLSVPLCLPPSRDTCVSHRNAVCERELEIQEERYQLTNSVIWRTRGQGLRREYRATLSISWESNGETCTPFLCSWLQRALPAFVLPLCCPLDVDKGVQLKELTSCLCQRSRQTKTTTSKQREEETIGCQLLINKFSLDCF